MTDQVVEQVPAEQQQAEADAAFASGFDGARGVSPEPKPQVEAKTEEKIETKEEAPKPEAATEPPKEEQTPDPLAEIKQQLAGISTKLGDIDKLDHRFKSYEGRLGAINKTMEGLAAARTAAASAVATDASVQAQKDIAEKYAAKLKQAKDDYPELADFVEAAREELRASFPKAQSVDTDGLKKEVDSNVAQRLAEIQAQSEQRVAEAIAQAEEMAYVRIKYPTWKQDVQTPEFRSWFEAQTPEVQALAASSNGDDAIRMLDAYQAAKLKAEKDKQQKEANERRLRGAVTPKGQPAAQPASLTDEEVFELGFKSERGR